MSDTKSDQCLCTEVLAKWFKDHGVKDPQTAWELACDAEPLLRRLIDAYRDVVTR